jgi:methionine-rich copper-binding protein CopC
MSRFFRHFRLALVLMLGVLAPRVALAHAFLDHAVPGVGATVSGSPGELQLTFTQDIELALSGVKLTTAAGAAVSTGRPSGSGSTMSVRLGRALAPGTYIVHWHVVSVDTHPTSGTFKFTVAP